MLGDDDVEREGTVGKRMPGGGRRGSLLCR